MFPAPALAPASVSASAPAPALEEVEGELLPKVRGLRETLAERSAAFADIVKISRIQLDTDLNTISDNEGIMGILNSHFLGEYNPNCSLIP